MLLAAVQTELSELCGNPHLMHIDLEIYASYNHHVVNALICPERRLLCYFGQNSWLFIFLQARVCVVLFPEQGPLSGGGGLCVKAVRLTLPGR